MKHISEYRNNRGEPVERIQTVRAYENDTHQVYDQNGQEIPELNGMPLREVASLADDRTIWMGDFGPIDPPAAFAPMPGSHPRRETFVNPAQMAINETAVWGKHSIGFAISLRAAETEKDLEGRAGEFAMDEAVAIAKDLYEETKRELGPDAKVPEIITGYTRKVFDWCYNHMHPKQDDTTT